MLRPGYINLFHTISKIEIKPFTNTAHYIETKPKPINLKDVEERRNLDTANCIKKLIYR